MALGVPDGVAYQLKFFPFAAAIIMKEKDEADLHPLLGCVSDSNRCFTLLYLCTSEFSRVVYFLLEYYTNKST